MSIFRKHPKPNLHDLNHDYTVDLETNLRILDKIEQRLRLTKAPDVQQAYDRQVEIVAVIQKCILKINQEPKR
jgi:hypothetical protein